MRIFVTGATGAIGRFVVPQLVGVGHEVTGLARSPEKAAALEAAGARAAHVSLFDAVALRDALSGHDAVANLATAIPPVTKAANRSAWLENARIRTEGSRAVVDAALAADVGRVIQESITFIYPDRGAEWIDEDVPVDVPDAFGSVLDAEESASRFAAERDAVVLRFAQFYGPGSHHTEVFLAAARRHLAPIVGRGRDYVSNIHLHDAAAAVVAALRAPSGIYNVVDDHPMTKREVARLLGKAVGKRPWLSSPGRLATLGGRSASLLLRSQRVSNQRFRETTGWVPAYPSVREGFATLVKEPADA